MSNERLISIEGLATIRSSITADLTKPVSQQNHSQRTPIVLALLHELDLANKREAELTSALERSRDGLASANSTIQGLNSDLTEVSGVLEELTDALRAQNNRVEDLDNELNTLTVELASTQFALALALDEIDNLEDDLDMAEMLLEIGIQSVRTLSEYNQAAANKRIAEPVTH